VFTLRKVLKKVEQDREVRTAKRKDILKASLVGYTNAGKSTLFNQMTKAGVATGARLFETLDTTTRLVRLPSKETMLLSDTVGFIRKLPHHLVASFHATLECVIEADVVIHVADLSHPGCESQIATVRSVLEDIGAGRKREVLVLNKADLVQDESLLRQARRAHEGAVAVSALRGWGTGDLTERLLEVALEDKCEFWVSVPHADGKMLSHIQRYGKVLDSRSVDSEVRFLVRVARRYARPLEKFIVRS
jgi:GTP-binding protein HflX